jgi:hypothetical protein
MSPLLEAVDLALNGDWQGAHRIAQERDDDATANWIHAVLHRIEGDLENARYWYQRCRRELREEVSTEAELREIRAALLAAEAELGPLPRRTPIAKGDSGLRGPNSGSRRARRRSRDTPPGWAISMTHGDRENPRRSTRRWTSPTQRTYPFPGPVPHP